jgi:hypothetical protein
MWKPHQLDFLKGMIVQGNLSEAQLRKYVADGNGSYNLTTLANQTMELTIDETRDVLLVAGGDLYFSDIHGVDGMLHFTTKVPLVRSVTHSTYDIADWLGHFYDQLNLIDSIFLDDDMKRLEPMTALFAPDYSWRNKVIPLDRVEYILESHIFKSLLWCDVLREYAPGSGHENEGKKIESENGAEWAITLNGKNMPCFTAFIGLGQQLDACVVECDILARNGIVHALDEVLLDAQV